MSECKYPITHHKYDKHGLTSEMRPCGWCIDCHPNRDVIHLYTSINGDCPPYRWSLIGYGIRIDSRIGFRDHGEARIDAFDYLTNNQAQIKALIEKHALELTIARESLVVNADELIKATT